MLQHGSSASFLPAAVSSVPQPQPLSSSIHSACIDHSRLQLDSKVVQLTVEIDQLTTERDRLASTLADLKQLLTRIAKENSQESVKQAAVNVRTMQTQLKEKLAQRKLCIKAAEEHSGRYQRLCDFWQDIDCSEGGK